MLIRKLQAKLKSYRTRLQQAQSASHSEASCVGQHRRFCRPGHGRVAISDCDSRLFSLTRRTINRMALKACWMPAFTLTARCGIRHLLFLEKREKEGKREAMSFQIYFSFTGFAPRQSKMRPSKTTRPWSRTTVTQLNSAAKSLRIRFVNVLSFFSHRQLGLITLTLPPRCRQPLSLSLSLPFPMHRLQFCRRNCRIYKPCKQPLSSTTIQPLPGNPPGPLSTLCRPWSLLPAMSSSWAVTAGVSLISSSGKLQTVEPLGNAAAVS